MENMWQKINETDIPPYLSWRGYNGVKGHEQTDIECPYPAWQLIIARDILKWAFMVADKQGRVKLTINTRKFMTKEEIEKLAEFVKGGYCTFTKEQVIEALTALDKAGKDLKRREDYEEEGDFDIGEGLSLDEVEKYILKLKEEGWEGIDMRYYDGSFYVYRHIKEPDGEYRCRLSNLIKDQLWLINEKKNKKIRQMIAKKKEEIDKLESMLK